MEYLLLTRRDRIHFTDQEAAALFPAEAAVVAELKQAGVLKAIWSRDDVAGACLLIEANDETAVQRELQRLPLFKAGMLAIEKLVPLKPY